MFGAQWAYNGKPLYFWFKDTAPGQVTGDGVDGFHVAR
jgi:predicted lipoprotein with Yx(FWY)xxD motif